MFIGELFEAAGRQVTVIYPGRFQPFHKGHAAVYNHLCQQWGAGNVYICTSDKTDNAKSPFSFEEKKKMMVLTGINPSRVVFSTQPYRAMEIVNHLDAASSILLFAVSEKDMAEDPRFSFAPKKDGSPSYFQPFANIKQCETLAKHAYMITVPTFNFTVLDRPANSASEIRAQFASADERTQKKMVEDLFGKFDSGIYNVMKAKLVPQGIMSEGIIDSIKSLGSKKSEPKMLPLTDQQRNTIRNNFKSGNLDTKWSPDGAYVLPHNARVDQGRSSIHFRNQDGQLMASVAHYSSSANRVDRHSRPMIHTDHAVTSLNDINELKNFLEESVTEKISREKLEKMIADLEKQDGKTKTTSASSWAVGDRLERLKTRLKNLTESYGKHARAAANYDDEIDRNPAAKKELGTIAVKHHRRAFNLAPDDNMKRFHATRMKRYGSNKSNVPEGTGLSPETLASYKKKAGADATDSDNAGDIQRGNKRFRGIVQATKKEFDNDAKKHKVSENKKFNWTDYEDLAMESRLDLLEAWLTGNESMLLEENDSNANTYFLGLKSDSPTPGKKYIMSLLALVNNKIAVVHNAEIVTFVKSSPSGHIVKLQNGSESVFPPDSIKHMTTTKVFFFSNQKAYDSFRSAIKIKFDKDLPNINATAIDEGWKDNVASAAVLGGVALAGGSLVGVHNSIQANTVHIDGHEFYQKSLPHDTANIKIKTDEHGNKVYAWVETNGNKPSYWFSPVNKKPKVTESQIVAANKLIKQMHLASREGLMESVLKAIDTLHPFVAMAPHQLGESIAADVEKALRTAKRNL